MSSLLQDLRYGWRMLAKHPGFTAVAVLTLALGIGANTAIFSVVNAVLLRPLPYAEPEAILQVEETHRDSGRVNLTGATFLDLHERNQSFSRVAAYRSFPTPQSLVTDGASPHNLLAAQISQDFFAVMGGEAQLGRLFQTEDFEQGAPHVVLLSEAAWHRVFGGDPAAVGRNIRLSDMPFTIAGVLRADFRHPAFAEIWIPLTRAGLLPENRRSHLLGVVGRLRPGTSMEQAQSELQALAQQIDAETGRVDAGLGFVASSLHARMVEPVRPALVVLMGAVGLLLLVACVNVASLVMARSIARHREIGIRVALGATRARITVQMLTESVLLALLGGALGLLLGAWGVSALVALAPAQLPRLGDVSLDGGVFLFTFLLSLGAALLFGLWPAWRASRTDVLSHLQEGARGSGGAGRKRWRQVLVGCEVAIALVLVAGAALLGRSMLELLRVDVGFQSSNLVTFGVSPSRMRYPTNTAQAALFEQITERIRALPGVEGVALTNSLPTLGAPSTTFEPEGRPPLPGEQELSADVLAVSPGYFQLMRIPLLRGRKFGAADGPGAPVAVIISEAAGRAFWPGEDPIGKRLTMRDWNDPLVAEVAGIVADVQQRTLDRPVFPAVYFSHAQFMDRIFGLNVVVRTALPAGSISAALAEQVWAVDKDQPLADLRTFDEILARSIAQERFNTLLLGILALLGLSLAAAGIYGIMSFSVSQRRQEIGIRMALGAQRSHILRLVVGQGMLPVAAGIAAGVAGGLALTRLLAGLLFQVAPSDTIAFVSAILLLAIVALLACYIPARRASKVDPMVALRTE